MSDCIYTFWHGGTKGHWRHYDYLKGQWIFTYGGKMAKKKLMAKAFDVVTCENGHACYLTSKIIGEGTRMTEHDYIPLDNAPRVVLSIQIFETKCPKCEGKVFQATSDGNYGLRFYNRGKLMGEGVYLENE